LTIDIFDPDYKAQVTSEMEQLIQDAADKDFRVKRLLEESTFKEAYKEFLGHELLGDGDKWRLELDRNSEIFDELKQQGVNLDVYFGGIDTTSLTLTGKEVHDHVNSEDQNISNIWEMKVENLYKETEQAMNKFYQNIRNFISKDNPQDLFAILANLNHKRQQFNDKNMEWAEELSPLESYLENFLFGEPSNEFIHIATFGDFAFYSEMWRFKGTPSAITFLKEEIDPVHSEHADDLTNQLYHIEDVIKLFTLDEFHKMHEDMEYNNFYV